MTTKECQSLRRWASALQAERSSLGDVLAEYADAWEREAAQPPATSGMPEMPIFPLWAVSHSKGYLTIEADQVERVLKEQRTACYAAGRRQGLEEAAGTCKTELAGLTNGGARNAVKAIIARLKETK